MNELREQIMGIRIEGAHFEHKTVVYTHRVLVLVLLPLLVVCTVI